jgi:hypothetical protein
MEPAPRKFDGKFAVMLTLVLALAVANIHAIRQAGQAHQRLDQVQRSLEARLATVNEQAQAIGARADRATAALQQQLQEARRTVTTSAERRAQQLVGKLGEEYRRQQSALASELGEVKQAASNTGEKVASVAADVNSVRGDVAQTRSELETARTELGSQLKTMKGDLGIQSGLIATNARELAALRELGERHYFEFALAKTGRPYKVANIAMVLRKTDPKRNKFTLDVLADDKKVEKKDKNLNEPVQFYVARLRQPYELVVNDVKKDRIVGYLAVPKVLETAAR